MRVHLASTQSTVLQCRLVHHAAEFTKLRFSSPYMKAVMSVPANLPEVSGSTPSTAVVPHLPQQVIQHCSSFIRVLGRCNPSALRTARKQSIPAFQPAGQTSKMAACCAGSHAASQPRWCERPVCCRRLLGQKAALALSPPDLFVVRPHASERCGAADTPVA